MILSKRVEKSATTIGKMMVTTAIKITGSVKFVEKQTTINKMKEYVMVLHPDADEEMVKHVVSKIYYTEITGASGRLIQFKSSAPMSAFIRLEGVKIVEPKILHFPL
jgi:hypothetical protein